MELAERIANATAELEESQDRTTQRILDAALTEAAVTGIRRLTVEDVAKRAGLSRMTLYRRYPSREELVQALVDRETQRFLRAVASGGNQPEPIDSLTEGFVAAVAFTRGHPMLRRAAQAEPGSIIDAELLAVGSAFIARNIHGDRPGPPSREARWVADAWARLFITYVLLPPTDPDFDNDQQLRRFARDVLAPMVK